MSKVLRINWEDAGVWHTYNSENEISSDDLALVDQNIFDLIKFEDGKFQRAVVTEIEPELEEGEEETEREVEFQISGWESLT